MDPSGLRQTDEQQRTMSRYMGMSAGLHVALFLALGIGQFFSPKAIVAMPTVQVDIVALPNQVKNAENPPVDTSLPVKPNPPPPPEAKPEETAKPEPKDAPPKEEPPKPAPKEPDEDMALERKKAADAKKRAEAALKKMREQLQKQRQAEDAAKREKRKEDLKAFEQKYRQALAGNQKNQGNAVSGQLQATSDAYAAAVADRIRANWALPSFLQGQNLEATIIMRLDGHGNVTSMRFTRTSGNTLFDDNAEKAIRNASPMPPPPAELAPALRSGGMQVGFPL